MAVFIDMVTQMCTCNKSQKLLTHYWWGTCNEFDEVGKRSQVLGNMNKVAETATPCQYLPNLIPHPPYTAFQFHEGLCGGKCWINRILHLEFPCETCTGIKLDGMLQLRRQELCGFPLDLREKKYNHFR